ncbi:hypothetical protein SNEBB_004462 [Seison nebaliae]|nr:hypothetical protein SNEBB_004462 [Seison nebaliae]
MSYFLYCMNGSIDFAELTEFDDIFIKFVYVNGPDWLKITGIDSGATQISHKSQDERGQSSFNFPLEITYKSTCPYGWPQIVVSCYGPDMLGRDVVRGYGSVHLPMSPGRHYRRIALFVPQSTSLHQQFLSWIRGRRPEYVDPRIVAHSEGREITRCRSQGYINLSFNVVIKDLSKLGYRILPNFGSASDGAEHLAAMMNQIAITGDTTIR